MFTNFSEFFTCVKEARFSFKYIWDAIVSLYYDITMNPDISAIWEAMMGSIQSIYKLVMTLLAVGCVIVALFGKKMIGFLKFLFFFVVGFALGTHLLTPVISEAVEIPGWIVGTVVALVAAVLYRFLYIVLYSVTAGYGMYILAYHGFYLQGESAYSNAKAISCLIAAVVIVVIAIIFKKYIEMLGTAALGGWLASWIFANFVYNFTTFPIFGGITWVAILVPAVIIAAIGAVVQIKTRRRY